MPKQPFRVLILGAGMGGIAAANRMRRRLPTSARVTVVDRSHRFVFQPSLLWVMSGDRRPDAVHRPVPDLLHRGVEFLRAGVRALDPAERRVETDSGSLTADAIVVALGAETDPAAVPGFRQGAANLYDFEGAVAARRRLSVTHRGRVVIFVSSAPYKCPPAPYEAALLLEDSLRRRGVRGGMSITLVTPEPRPLPALDASLGEMVAGLLAQRDVEFLPSRRVARVDAGGRSLTLEDGARLEAEVLIGVPPHRCPAALTDCGLAPAGGWLPVDAHTLATGFEGVWAVGDCTTVPIAGGFLPKAGVFAEGQAKVVADAVCARAEGREASKRYEGRGACYLEIGGGLAGVARGDFYARPEPRVELKAPRPWWHWAKVGLEKRWLRSGM